MDAKKIAARMAIEEIREYMVVGLGTGSTAELAIRMLGDKVKDGMKIKAVASSTKSEKLARELNIPIVSFEEIKGIDLTIDGADEVDKENNLIKGGGGALLREKILAYHSKAFYVIVDESKLVDRLGRFQLPIEIVSFASNLTVKKIESVGGKPFIRKEKGEPWVTDNGNMIVDCDFYPINDPESLHSVLVDIPGVVETGLFLKNLITKVFIGFENEKVVVR